jgi:hypothetical protein
VLQSGTLYDLRPREGHLMNEQHSKPQAATPSTASLLMYSVMSTWRKSLIAVVEHVNLSAILTIVAGQVSSRLLRAVLLSIVVFEEWSLGGDQQDSVDELLSF